MTKSITDLFLNILPPHKKSAKGWMTFNCPSCGDTRGRGAFIVSDTNGWRYSCRNGGCDFNATPTGWEPESGLGGRVRKLYTLLGGQTRDLPLDLLFKKGLSFNKRNQVVDEAGETAIYHFDRVELPTGSIPLMDPGEYLDNKCYQQVLNYLVERSEDFLSLHEFYWSKALPNYLIIPYYHHRQIVGYLARNTVDDDHPPYIQKCHSDYLFNQQVLSQDSQWVILGEGVLDGIAMSGVGARGTSLTPKQELLLNLSGKEIIVLPDQETDGLNLVDCAERNGWWVASPVWDRGVKDASKALNCYGMLYTIESVRASAHKNYLKAKTSIKLKNESGKRKAHT